MNERYTSLGKAYLYKLYNGELREYSGEVFIDEGYIDMMSSDCRGRARFYILNENGIKVKAFTCCDLSDEVYNGMVWMNTADRSRAAWLLRDYMIRRVQRLQDDIKRYEKSIDILGKEIIESE